MLGKLVLWITSLLWMSLNNAEEYLEGGYQVDGARLCLVVCSQGTRDDEHRLEHRKCHTDMRKKLLIVLVTGHWNRLPRDVLGGSFSGDIQNPRECFPV